MTTDIRFKPYFYFITALSLCVAGAALSFSLGQAAIPPGEIAGFLMLKSQADGRYHAILKMRVLRMAAAFITGAGLAFAGVVYQSSLKNYLADPFMLGISAGAALFSALAITMKFHSSLAISAFAFTGAILSVGAVMAISYARKFSSYNLILTGIALNSFFSSFLTVVMYLSKDMQNIFFWLMGSLDVRYADQIIYTYLFVVGAACYILKYSHILDLLRINEKTVFSIGVDQNYYKIKFLVIASLICALIVSQTGIIGFVGLIVPHAARIMVGDSHRILLPFSFVLGGTMLIYCDLISRTAADSINFPIGIITSLVGAPFFIFLLAGQRKAGARANG
ncbi:MAG TPA: iron ABC transporter permease [Candidatus Wallbacteria bacterium]|nr:MAG: Hemin transport system permease protein HmuU [bacterium ADurb.Bin243]HOD41243.1 iron ABC transporter permease [Candidatus Wallbacteria bacterium]HPG56359.1 iron ABC transporter permease [Candidatus Wallbacteria bacterium]